MHLVIVPDEINARYLQVWLKRGGVKSVAVWCPFWDKNLITSQHFTSVEVVEPITKDHPVLKLVHIKPNRGLHYLKKIRDITTPDLAQYVKQADDLACEGITELELEHGN